MNGRDPELMMIGDFAGSVGLTASALRFYADSGVLEPAEIDPVSGYRLYSADQHDTAVLLRRLRDLDLPLPDVRRVLSASSDTAARIIEEHVSSLIDTTAEIRRTAEELITGFPTAPSTHFLATFRGFSLAEALDQVLTATVREPGIPVLSSVQMCVGPDAVTFVATDRYRLVIRTVVPEQASEPVSGDQSFVLCGDDVRELVSAVRRMPRVRLGGGDGTRLVVEAPFDNARLDNSGVGSGGGPAVRCRTTDEVFPDWRLMLDHLPEPSLRVTLPTREFLRALDTAEDDRIPITADGGGGGEVAVGKRIPEARVDGTGSMTAAFALTTLYPAVTSAIGPDLMLELRGPDQPATVRSADRGDLTVLVMPVTLSSI